MNVYESSPNVVGNPNENSNVEDHNAVFVNIPEAAGGQGVKRLYVVMCLAENSHY